MTKKPIIGIIPDFMLGDKEKYSEFDFYAARSNYCDSIIKAGGAPIFLSYSFSDIENYSNIIDGLVIIGGNFDIDPSLYKNNFKHAKTELNEIRSKFEFAMFKHFFATQKPILGICAGLQLINVIFGGDLIQHIPDFVKSNINHEQQKAKNLVSHEIYLKKDSKLYSIYNTDKTMVNSTHHQAIGKLGEGLTVSSNAPDGIIESIEHNNHKFCLGVQWHPEYLSTQHDFLLFNSFIEHCI